MPITYREVTSGVTSRLRFASAVANGRLWMPAANVGGPIGHMDFATETYGELAASARARRMTFNVGGTLYMPSLGHASCGKVDTSTITFSEFAIGRAANWTFAGVLIGTTIHMFHEASPTTWVVGKIDTTSDTYSEVVQARPSPTGGSLLFGPPFLIGGLVYMFCISNGIRRLGTYNPADDSLTLDPWPSIGDGSAPVQANGNVWYFRTSAEIFGIPSGDSVVEFFSAGVRNTGAALGNTVWWVSQTTDVLTSFDTSNLSWVEHTGIGITLREKWTSQIVGNTMWLPSSNHGSIGVLEGLPAPSRGRRGLGLVR